MQTLITKKLHIDTHISSAAARLTASRLDEDRDTRRIVRVTNDIYKIGSNGDEDALAKCSAKYEEMKTNLVASASRSTTISD
jgi:hypothetical protein